MGFSFSSSYKKRKRILLLKMVFSVSIILSLGKLMKDTLRYLAGIPGPSGYGSKSTAEQVSLFSSSSSQLTAIITGKLLFLYFSFEFFDFLIVLLYFVSNEFTM